MRTIASNARTGARLRDRLLTSAAGICMLAVAGSAAAAPLDDTPSTGHLDVSNAELVAQSSGPVSINGAELVPQIVISDPGTPTSARDPVNVNGVGQMIIDEQNGFIGLCTGTLINPRTVIFAAHCVNERPANAYGADSGGQPIGFGFSNNNNQAGASAFGQWLSTYQTNTDRYMYNANYVAYNPVTLEPGNEFLYGDIALASLDTPAANVPTWSVLFSQLPDPGTITKDGTGYHVAITGYGNNGTGTTGSIGGIDFRRRVAENTLGALASLDEFESFIFGSPNGLTQNLYWIDFDDPRRGSGTESVFDFNAWRDNALPNEGITASGDSGGPLILDEEYAKKVVIGVLSGGYTRFFGQQPPNGYGTASFYQPLYLYWDWIAANNPYHYVSAKAGDGDWFDANHWVTNLDPAYQIIGPDGNLVNGIPGTPGSGTADEDGFGQACFQSGGISDCLDIASGDETIEQRPIGQGGSTTDDRGSAAVGTLSPELASQAAGAQVVASLPPATLDNGLPGASNFVPNNDDGDAPNSVKPRYFDVTLSAAGTTTLNADAEIDRFTIDNGSARLNVGANGSLISLMDFNHKQGVVNVDGFVGSVGDYTISGANAMLSVGTSGTVVTLGEFHQLSGIVKVDGELDSYGDYLLFAGGLTGKGQIWSPYFTNMLGTIAPGTPGTIGTLTFNGNLILTAGSGLLIDVGPNGTSDLVAVKSTLPPVNGVAQDGIASLGGSVVVSPISGYQIHNGDSFTILTAEGGIETGTTFNGVPISAILTPVFTYGTNAVKMKIQAGLYRDVIATNAPLQNAYAQLLDQNRPQAAKYEAIYGPLDLQNQATIRSTFDAMGVGGPTTIQSLGIAAQQNMANFIQDRLATVDTAAPGGGLALIGNPTQFAMASFTGMPLTQAVATDATTPMVEQGKLPETMSAFLAGGYLTGNSMPVSVGMTNGRDQYDGWFAAGGVEASIGDHAVIGFAVSYTQVDGDGSIAGQTATGKLYQGTLYGKIDFKGGTLDAQFSAGAFDTKTTRLVPFLGNTYTIEAQDTPLALTGELGLGKDFDIGTLAITPRAAVRYSYLGFTPTAETGGPLALQYDRGTFDSFQGRLGARLHGTMGVVKPYLSANYVHEFGNQPASFGANFVGGIGPNAIFALGGEDKNWGEISGGLSFSTGNVDLGIAADTTVWRSDVESQSYRGSITVHF